VLVTAFGTSTLYAYWGFAFIGHLLNDVYGDYCYVHCSTRDELRAGWQGRAGRAAFVTSDRPDPDLAALLLEFDFPVIAFIDSPEDQIDTAIRTRDPAHDQSCRFSTQLLSSLEPVLMSPKTRVFGPEWYERPLSEMARELSHIILEDSDEDQIARIVAKAIPDVSGGPQPTVWQAVQHKYPKALTPLQGFREERPAHQQLIRAVSDAYRPILEGRRLTDIEWPKELFYFSSEGCAPPSEIELMGKARHLVWGPYLYLPLGFWRAHVQFEIAENLSGNQIEADVLVGGTVAEVKRGDLPVLGAYEFFVDFEVKNIAEPIEVRMKILTGAIEGRFGLRKVTVVRREPDSQESLPPSDSDQVRKLTNAGTATREQV
jgi:hypothetical protein